MKTIGEYIGTKEAVISRVRKITGTKYLNENHFIQDMGDMSKSCLSQTTLRLILNKNTVKALDYKFTFPVRIYLLVRKHSCGFCMTYLYPLGLHNAEKYKDDPRFAKSKDLNYAIAGSDYTQQDFLQFNSLSDMSAFNDYLCGDWIKKINEYNKKHELNK